MLTAVTNHACLQRGAWQMQINHSHCSIKMLAVHPDTRHQACAESAAHVSQSMARPAEQADNGCPRSGTLRNLAACAGGRQRVPVSSTCSTSASAAMGTHLPAMSKSHWVNSLYRPLASWGWSRLYTCAHHALSSPDSTCTSNPGCCCTCSGPVLRPGAASWQVNALGAGRMELRTGVLKLWQPELASPGAPGPLAVHQLQMAGTLAMW